MRQICCVIVVLGMVNMLKNEVSGIGANGLLDSCNEPCDQAEKGQQVEENDECVADFRLANEKDAIVPGHQDCDCEGKCVDPVQNLQEHLLPFFCEAYGALGNIGGASRIEVLRIKDIVEVLHFFSLLY